MLALLEEAFLVEVHEFAVVVDGLKNWGVSHFFFDSTFTYGEDFFFVGVCQNLQKLFFALGAVVGSVDHLFCFFDEDFDAVVGGSIGLVYGAHTVNLQLHTRLQLL